MNIVIVTYFRRCANRVEHRIRSFGEKDVKWIQPKTTINRLIEKGS